MSASGSRQAPPFRKDVTRTFIDLHVRRAIEEGVVRGSVLNIGGGTQTYEDDLRRYHGSRMIVTDWPSSPTRNCVDVFCDAHELPFGSGAFDSVVCTEVLEHLAAPGRAVKEIHRVLRPGGAVLMTTPFQYQAHQRPYDFFRFTYDGLGLMTREAGFGDVVISRRGESLAVSLNALKVFTRRVGVPRFARLIEIAERLYVRWYGERSLALPLKVDAMALGYTVVARKGSA